MEVRIVVKWKTEKKDPAEIEAEFKEKTGLQPEQIEMVVFEKSDEEKTLGKGDEK